MKILGIDYGGRKVGLAVAEGALAEPLKILRYKDIKILSEQIKQVVLQEKIEKVIVGISEGKTARETEDFVLALRPALSTVPTETFDETLSTHEAQRLSLEAGMKRKKRKSLEDAFAAAVMLQSYLETHV